MKSLLIFILSLVAFPAFASSATYVWAQGRFVVHSPQYYSSTTADLSVSLKSDLPYGSTVRVQYGFGSQDGSWQGLSDVAAPAVGPWEWRADFSQVLHERGWNRAYTKMEFVFVITLPDGSVRYEKGNDSVFGYYEAALPEPGTITEESSREFHRLVVYNIARN